MFQQKTCYKFKERNQQTNIKRLTMKEILNIALIAHDSRKKELLEYISSTV